MVIDLAGSWKLRTIELRSLLNETNKEITINPEIEKAFNIWRDKMKKVDGFEEIKLLQSFYAGYILANPIVREQYIKSVE